jgi:ubiquinone/menaquinone biosynthesis C-methylase UbiE
MKITGLNDTIDWYDQNSEQYAKGLYAVTPEASIGDVIKYLPPNSYVLEAGCGPGRETQFLRAKGLKTTGIDLSKGLLEIARKMNPETEYVQGNFLKLPFPENTFDGVWSHASLVHLETIEDVKKALEEFHRVLKTGGIVFVKVKEQQGEEKTAVVADALSNHERFFRYYTMEEMTDLLTEAGFEILETMKRGDDHGRPEVSWIEIIAKKM